MHERQHPIPTRFDRESTVDDVLAGADLTGRTAVVTGGYSGLGLETTKALSNAGATVIVPARHPAAAAVALESVNATVAELDLMDPNSVGAFSDWFLGRYDRADLVICNAGIMACPETRSVQGWEAQFATNHLGHFALVNRLWPALRAAGSASGARVVSVSSGAHAFGNIRWDDPHFHDGSYERRAAYAQSKTANVLFAVGLDERAAPHGVRAFAVHPGSILTPLQRHLTRTEMIDAGWIDDHGHGIDPTFKTPRQGAATQVWAATSLDLDDQGGVYCEDCDIAAVAHEPGSYGVAPHAIDPDSADRLWRLSAGHTTIDCLEA